MLAVVDGSGTVQQSYAYDVFGAVTSQSGSLGSEQQFAGQQTDPDGLQDLRARFYDPATGRFLSRDSWSNDDKTVFHPYVYVNNNPSTGLDPTGHNGPDCEDDDCGDSGNGGDMAPLPTTPEGADPPVLPPDLSIGYLLWQELSRGVQLTLGPQLTTDLEIWVDAGVSLSSPERKGHVPVVDGQPMSSSDFGRFIGWGGNKGFDQTGTMQDAAIVRMQEMQHDPSIIRNLMRRGLTVDMAKWWRDGYGHEALNNPRNPSALGRWVLMTYVYEQIVAITAAGGP